MSSDEDDAELIGRSRGDVEAFGRLYDRYAPDVARYLGRRVGPEQVESLLADVFVVAFEARQRLDPQWETALPWLYGIARNLVRRHYRSVGREHAATRRLAGITAADGGARPGVEEAALATADAATDIGRVLDFLAGMPPDDLELLLLFAWEGLAYRDIAASLDIPVGTVKSRLNRVRRNVRRALA